MKLKSLVNQYEKQLREKVNRLNQMMLIFHPPKMEIFRSQPLHYRMRAEFRIWHNDQKVYHIMFDQHTKTPIYIDYFLAGSVLINKLMKEVTKAINRDSILRNKLFQINYITTLSDEAIITLIYHRPLDRVWYNCAMQLRNILKTEGYNVQLVGRSKGKTICLDCNYIDEYLFISGQTVVYRQIENGFIQPNTKINVHMLEWALSSTEHKKGDLLEFYCGNGNFTLVLSRHFEKVLAIEISKSLVEIAQHNIVTNRIDNVKIFRISTKEFIQTICGINKLIHLKEFDLKQYNCKTIFCNPPRIGLDHEVIAMIKNYPHIVYISCNPDSLYRNLTMLSCSHYIERLALFDQFPYTHHIECGISLIRKTKSAGVV